MRTYPFEEERLSHEEGCGKCGTHECTDYGEGDLYGDDDDVYSDDNMYTNDGVYDDDDEDMYDDPHDVVMYDIDTRAASDLYMLIYMLADASKVWYAKRRLNALSASGQLNALVAAPIIDSLGREWNPLLHPRDRFGKFINTGGFFRWFVKGIWNRGQVVRIDSDGTIYARSKGNDRIPDGQIIKFNHKDSAKFISVASDKADLTPESFDIDKDIPGFPEAAPTQKRLYNALQFGDMPAEDLDLYRFDESETKESSVDHIADLQRRGLINLLPGEDNKPRIQRADLADLDAVDTEAPDEVPDSETPDLDDSPNLTRSQRDLLDQMVELDRGEGDGVLLNEIPDASEEDLQAMVEAGVLIHDGDLGDSPYHLENPEGAGGDLDVAEAPDTDIDTTAPDVVDDIDKAAENRFGNNLEQQQAFANRGYELAGITEEDPDAKYTRPEKRARGQADAWWEEYNAPEAGGDTDVPETDIPESDVPEADAPAVKKRAEYRDEAKALMDQWFDDDYYDTPEGEKYLQGLTDILYAEDLGDAGEADRARMNREFGENKLRDIGIDEEDIAAWGPAIEAFRNDERSPDVPEGDVPEADVPDGIAVASREEVLDLLDAKGVFPRDDSEMYNSYLDDKVDHIVEAYNTDFRDDVDAGRTDDMSLREFLDEFEIRNAEEFNADAPDRFVEYEKFAPRDAAPEADAPEADVPEQGELDLDAPEADVLPEDSTPEIAANPLRTDEWRVIGGEPDDDFGELRGLDVAMEHTTPGGDVHALKMGFLMAQDEDGMWSVTDADISLDNAGNGDESLGRQEISLLSNPLNPIKADSEEELREKLAGWVDQKLAQLDDTGQLYSSRSRGAEDRGGNLLPGTTQFETLDSNGRAARARYRNDFGPEVDVPDTDTSDSEKAYADDLRDLNDRAQAEEWDEGKYQREKAKLGLEYENRVPYARREEIADAVAHDSDPVPEDSEAAADDAFLNEGLDQQQAIDDAVGTNIGEATAERLKNVDFNQLGQWADWAKQVRDRRDDDADLGAEMEDELQVAENMGLDLDAPGGVMGWNAFVKDNDVDMDIAEDLYRKHNGDAGVAALDYFMNKEDYDANGVAISPSPDTSRADAPDADANDPIPDTGSEGVDIPDVDSGEIDAAEINTPEVNFQPQESDLRPQAGNALFEKIDAFAPGDFLDDKPELDRDAVLLDRSGEQIEIGGWYKANRGGLGDPGQVLAFLNQDKYPGWMLLQMPDGKIKAANAPGDGPQAGMNRMDDPGTDARARLRVQRAVADGELLDLDQNNPLNMLFSGDNKVPGVMAVPGMRVKYRHNGKFGKDEEGVIARIGWNNGQGRPNVYVIKPGADSIDEEYQIAPRALIPVTEGTARPDTPRPATNAPDAPNVPDNEIIPGRWGALANDGEAADLLRDLGGEADYVDFLNGFGNPGGAGGAVARLIVDDQIEIIPGDGTNGRPRIRLADGDAPNAPDAPDTPNLPDGANSPLEGAILNALDGGDGAGLRRSELVDADAPDWEAQFDAFRDLVEGGVIEAFDDDGTRKYRRVPAQVDIPEAENEVEVSVLSALDGLDRPALRSELLGPDGVDGPDYDERSAAIQALVDRGVLRQETNRETGKLEFRRASTSSGTPTPMTDEEAANHLRNGGDALDIANENLDNALRAAGLRRFENGDSGLSKNEWVIGKGDGPFPVKLPGQREPEKGRVYMVKQGGDQANNTMNELMAWAISADLLEKGRDDKNGPLYHPRVGIAVAPKGMGKDRQGAIIMDHLKYGYPENFEARRGETVNDRWLEEGGAAKDVIKLGLYDYLINNSIDRHVQNQFFVKDPATGKVTVVIIDNGFSFGAAYTNDDSYGRFFRRSGPKGLLRRVKRDDATVRDAVQNFVDNYSQINVESMMNRIRAAHPSMTPAQEAYAREWLTNAKARADSLKNDIDGVVRAITRI